MPNESCGVAKDHIDGKRETTRHDRFFRTEKPERGTVMKATQKK